MKKSAGGAWTKGMEGGEDGSPTWGYKEASSMNLTGAGAGAAAGGGAAAAIGMNAMRGDHATSQDEPRPSFNSYENNVGGVTVSDLLSNGHGYGVVPQHVSS